MGLIKEAVKLAAVALPFAVAAPAVSNATAPVKQVTCGGKPYTYDELAGFGSLPGNATDKYGDTLGGFGSAIALEPGSWKKTGFSSYTGLLWVQPDRGWNTNGTLNYQARRHLLSITLTVNASATVAKPSGSNFKLKYLDTILYKDPSGQPTTGLDATVKGPYLTFPGIDYQFPTVNYTGDGFGGAGPGGRRVTIDAEGLAIAKNGDFWTSDEYGPAIYRIARDGCIISAISPPAAFIPRRNGSTSYSAGPAPFYAPNLAANPTLPDDGRNNNQGFEGLTISPDGKTLYVLLQSATIQDGGSKNKNRRNTRFLVYDVSKQTPSLTAEYVVQLPFYPDGSKVTAQSDIHYVNPTQFLILSRDSGSGAGLGNSTTSVYRHADVFDISKATNVHNLNGTDVAGGAVASTDGKLKSNITPAEYCPFIDYNDNSQLNRFGARNGGAQGPGLLNEKWESFALLPVDGKQGKDGEYFLLSISDNDFITQHGFQNFGKFKYQDASGANVDNQALVFKVKLPTQ